MFHKTASALLITTSVTGLMLLVVGCEDSVTLSNLPGHVSFVGPHAASDEGVVTWFGVSDPEGDFVAVEVEVCMSGDRGCFVPRLLPGSATIDTLPSPSADRSAALKIIWEPECDLLSADDTFNVHIRALGSATEDGIEGVRSDDLSLEQLGYACP